MTSKNQCVSSGTLALGLTVIAVALVAAAQTGDATQRACYLVAILVGMIVACRPRRYDLATPDSSHAALVNVVTNGLIVAACGLSVGLAGLLGASIALAAVEMALAMAGVTALRSGGVIAPHGSALATESGSVSLGGVSRARGPERDLAPAEAAAPNH